MKGQTQAVTAVMITGVVVGAVASTYVWGVPLLEKRQSQSNLQQIEEGALNLESSIYSVSQVGSGNSETVDLSLGNGKIDVDPDNNYIEFTSFAENAPYPVGSWSLLKGQSQQGVSFGAGKFGLQGENTPGIVAVQREGESSSAVTYRIEFRSLKTSTTSGPILKQVDIQSRGSRKASGDVTVHLINRGVETDSGGNRVEIDDGEDLRRRRNIVEVDLR